MTHANRWNGLAVLAACLTLGASAASAQTTVGNWGPINHEDAAERGRRSRACGLLRVAAY